VGGGGESLNDSEGRATVRGGMEVEGRSSPMEEEMSDLWLRGLSPENLLIGGT